MCRQKTNGVSIIILFLIILFPFLVTYKERLYTVPTRYGGNLQGVREIHPSLSFLGFTTISFTPSHNYHRDLKRYIYGLQLQVVLQPSAMQWIF